MEHEWGYSLINGPQTWANQYPEAAGERQSPVDIPNDGLKFFDTENKLTWKYVPENTEYITNTGYSWKVHVNGEGSSLTGGSLGTDKFVLEQFHCHWGEDNEQGSEHTVDNQKFAGELHFVHWNTSKYSSFEEAAKHSDGLCVLGIFLTPGKRHLELDNIIRQLPDIEYKRETVKIGTPINPAYFIPENSRYITYKGSLTTPPCSECVIWIVFKKPIEVSNEQLTSFRNMKSYCREDKCPCDDFQGFMKTNFRPTLPLGQREILECRQ